MNVNYEKTGDVEGIITISLEEKDYAPEFEKQLKEVAKKHKEPGFRPGHVPAGIIQKKFGDAVKYDTINKVVGDALFNYIKENKLHVLGNPVPMQDEDFNIKNADFTLRFKVGVAPEIDTHVGKEMKIPYYTIQVTDEMIDIQATSMRRRLGTQEPGDAVELTSVVKGQVVELSEDGSDKEGGLKVDDAIFSPEHFVDQPSKDLFIGKKVGDRVVFNPWTAAGGNEVELSSFLHTTRDDVTAHKGDFAFTITEIMNLKPAELNQEFYDSLFGSDKVHDEKEFRDAVRTLLENQLATDSNYRFTIDARDTIVKAVGDLQLPDAILKEYLISRDEALNLENIDQQYDAMRPQLQWELIREALLESLKVEVSREDLVNMAVQIVRSQMAQYGLPSVPDEMALKYAENLLKDEKSRNQIAQNTLDNKMFAAVREAVTLDEKSVSVEEFNKLFTAQE